MSRENKINYEELEEIVVTSQSELDMIPDGFKGRIYIESGVVRLTRVFLRRVITRGDAYVEVYENASVKAYENSHVDAYGNAYVDAYGNAYVVARGNAYIKAYENVLVEAGGNVHVEAYENVLVEARGNASVEARGNAYIKAWNNTCVKALENASVEAWGNSCIEAGGNVRVVAGSSMTRIQISGNARIVYYPKSIEDFMNFYGIKHDKKTAIFYKAVRRIEVAGKTPVKYQFVSDYISDFEYPIGSIVSAECDQDVSQDWTYGIHISYLGRAIDVGRDWTNKAIIEVETKIEDIILPINTNGNVRTSKVKVLREVPLEECGVFGKILARRRNK